MRRILFHFLALFLLTFLSSCAGKRHFSSSLMDYLYPNSQQTMEPTVPVLNLPLKVGIAFVPGQSTSGHDPFATWKVHRGDYDTISEKERMDLMKSVADEFRQYDYIESIELIPSGYLTKRGGFDNLQQIRTMYGLDVIALLSYDQVQNIDEGVLTMSYWTLVGAYLIKGEKNSTNTLMDAAIFHIPSNSLLFRAPGTSFVAGTATPVNLDEQLRKDSVEGFEQATANLVKSLKIQLDLFNEKVKTQPEKYKVISRPGSSYGSSTSAPFGLLLLAIGIAVWFLEWRRKI